MKPLRLQIASRAAIAARLRKVRSVLLGPRRAPGRSLSRPVLLTGAAALALGLVLLPFDGEISRALVEPPGGTASVLAVLTDAALIRWYFHPALLLALALLVTEPEGGEPGGRALHRRLAIHAAVLAASLGLASAITHALKWTLGRARPELLDAEGHLGFVLLRMGDAVESFPSGHSTNAGVVSAMLAIWVPALRWPILFVGACVAATRVPVGAHFASDVVAGFAIGTLAALVVARALALRGAVFEVRHGGRGWRGLLPRLAPDRDVAPPGGPA